MEEVSWLVETTPDVFEEVVAAVVAVMDAGVLVFRGSDEKLVMAYAASRWLTVMPGAE